MFDVSSRVTFKRRVADGGDGTWVVQSSSGWVHRGRIDAREERVNRTDWHTATCQRVSVVAEVRFKRTLSQTSHTMKIDFRTLDPCP